MKKTAVIGIDPGVTGCAALWTENNKVAFYDWQGIDAAANNIRLWRDQHLIIGAAIEKVLSHPKNGHRQAFIFGENFGKWQGILKGLGIDFALIQPKQWQRVIPGHLRGTSKDKSIAAARLLIPGIDRFINLKKHNGRADAILLAYYIKERVRLQKMRIQ